MYLQTTPQDKQPQTKWSEYLAYADEPVPHKRFEVSYEEADELLDSNYFLKQRVRRNMRRLQKEYMKAGRQHKAPRLKMTPHHSF